MNNRKMLRHEFSRTGWVMLIYLGLMNLCVTVVTAVDAVIRYVFSGNFGNPMAFSEIMNEVARQNGWGYILTSLIAVLLVLLWKKPCFFKEEILKKGNVMSVSSFFTLLCLMISCQFLSQVLVIIQEFVLNIFGMSIQPVSESASVDTDSFSMFLYAGIAAPIVEEFLCRGLLLRMLAPHGKKFAILATAFLFGIFHGNLIQVPFAFLAGILLGYIAMEYSILWSILFHMFNNLIVADLLDRVASFVPAVHGILWFQLLVGCTIVAVVILIQKRKLIAENWNHDLLSRETTLCFFTSPGVVTITVLMWLQMMISFFLMQI